MGTLKRSRGTTAPFNPLVPRSSLVTEKLASAAMSSFQKNRATTAVPSCRALVVHKFPLLDTLKVAPISVARAPSLWATVGASFLGPLSAGS